MNKLMAIYDSDTQYAYRFMEYIKHKKDIPFECMLFTEQASLKEYVTKHTLELLLSSEDLDIITELGVSNIKHLYFLSEEPGKKEGIVRIFKYQSAEDVISEILSEYAANEIEAADKNSIGRIKCISIYSPVPGLQKQEFAWSLALKRAEKRKTLFISMEVLPHSLIQFNDNSERILSEFIFYLKEKVPNIILKMKALCHQIDNLACLTGISYGMDILSLTREDLHYWYDALKAHSDYDTVVFYMEAYSGVMSEIINLSDCNLVITGNTLYEKALTKEWERQMSMIVPEAVKDRLKHVILNDAFEEDGLHSLVELKKKPTWTIAAEHVKDI